MNIAFFGSPEFSLPTLELLHQQKDLTISLVVTQPDKPSGRGLKLKPTPVKAKALELGLLVAEAMPSIEELKIFHVEKIVVVAYGKFIPAEMIHTWECINLHPSLLPKYRGPSPMQSALLNGDKETGISTMLLGEGMDDGDILLQEKIELDINTTLQELHDSCALNGAKLILETLRADIGSIRQKQDDARAVICKKIKNEDGEITAKDTPLSIHNKVRAIGGYIMHNNKRIKILETTYENNTLIIKTVQPEGKPAMSYNNYINGYGVLPL